MNRTIYSIAVAASLLVALPISAAVMQKRPAVAKTIEASEPFFKSDPVCLPDLPVLNTRASEHNLTIKLNFDHEKFDSYGDYRIVGQDLRIGSWAAANDEGNYEAVVTLPEGKMVVFAEFGIVDDSKMFRNGGFAWILKEIELDGDQTVELNPDDAICTITCRSTLPDGSFPQLHYWYYPAGGEGEHFDGNVSQMIISSELYHDEYGFIYGRGSMGDFGIINENGGRSFQLEEVADIHINPLGSEVHIGETVTTASAEGVTFSVMQPLSNVTESLTGDFETDFSTIGAPEFVRSPLSEKSEEEAFDAPYYFNASYIYNGEVATSDRAVAAAKGLIQAAGLHNMSAKNKLRFNWSIVDYGHTVYEEGEPIGFEVFTTQLQPIAVGDGSNPAYEVVQLNDGFTAPVNGYSWDYNPIEGHPAFSCSVAACRNIAGDSQPSLKVCSRLEYDWDSEDYIWYMDPLPTGRLGEFRASDTLVSELSQEELEGGINEIRLSVANCIVDGIEGHTQAVVRVNPDKDICPPVVQQVQFRTVDGIITDRIDNASDGIVRIAAGDFNQVFAEDSESQWWYEGAEASLKVEFAPVGTDEWAEVAMEERPEWYVREFGNLYEGSLEGLDKEGWYDMRITQTDADGSFAQQVISPAVKIGESTGVAAVNANIGLVISNGIATVADGLTIEVYSLGGNLLKVGKGSLDLSGLPVGVYVVRSGSRSVKYLAR